MPRGNQYPRFVKLFLLLWMMMASFKSFAQSIPLANAFAHNDYWHKRPLFDALDNGFTHVEADIYLRNGKLIVAHILPMLEKTRTLESLYLAPLMDCISGTSKLASRPVAPITLMIDIKSNANKTYSALEVLLDKYRSVISGYENGVYVQRHINVVITGNKPFKMLKAEQNRLAFIDEDLMKTYHDTLATNVYQTASCKYGKIVKWNGKGEMPTAQKQKLIAFVNMAHKFGKKVRLWASPESELVWTQLLNCGVDLINTDKLQELKGFLLARQGTYANVNLP
ncbi:phosphatidylinositol-specific phospholipase C/glycerophosphodiester phosphodiesterase family protein [Mucilaginibacter gilvus]|uniref:Altered inheritance of mitochondria protein 6 n=1 Tax=Mucilaginibacter gilvus TaxID=2305909 RepID=A0A3S3VD93_9SPHI|nr:phosphatidylinositol-specific phospholipase C/glycerophosphodiester phosphodiesterase family protein [Mucilaginibacter gilvus]RWY50848.1 hypothetical protein EPL05_12290 [Mucilaginibacter gilvus]